MTADPYDELAAAATAMVEMTSVGQRLIAARARAAESAERAAAAYARVRDEADDVAKLESLSLTSILARLSGSRDDKLAREAAEHDAAQYEHASLQARADADQRAADTLAARYAELPTVQARYDAALADKERRLVGAGGARAARLSQLAEERGRLTAELAELEQARDAGRRAVEHLAAAAAKLESARSWSAYDTWSDGGVVASLVKHNRLDDVATRIRDADTALAEFTNELADVHMSGVRLVELGDLTRVFDVWFDNIFTDLAVRGRIVDAQAAVQQAIGGVHRIQTMLRERAQQRSDQLAWRNADRIELLSTAVL
ncbi:hypothetical protein [Mycobacterium sp. GA-2829]|uniref:hypothetical protein n=1 Tax=Mycobacterium sp. GA-2829 TaxID=1772283 RepID=UPI00073FCC46|nr:hypothetical protein [Mycobacterium sp. GA-2829]KUI36273.1 hypothetical protein AU194_16300 [Mycobacterium sp. GA-2829]